MTNVLLNIGTEVGAAEQPPSVPAPAALPTDRAVSSFEDALLSALPLEAPVTAAPQSFGIEFASESIRPDSEIETLLETPAQERVDDELSIAAFCATTVIAPHVALPVPQELKPAAPTPERSPATPLLLKIATTQIAPPESSLRLALQMTLPPTSTNPSGIESAVNAPSPVTQLDAVALAVRATRTDHSASSSMINGEQLALLASQSSLHVPPAFALATDETAIALSPQPSIAQRQSLTAILGERLHMQINQRSEHAVIRLDPPSMGSIEIVIRQESGGLTVQMRASHPEVARQLHAIGDTLRQDLVQRQHGDVSVQVSDQARDATGDHRRRHAPAAPWQDDPGQALRDAGVSDDTSFALQTE